MAQSVPPAASRWLEPLAQRARASRMAAAELRAAVESPVALAHKKAAQTRAAEVLDASSEMGLLLAALKQDLGVTTRTAR
jgi:hypothetical protein